LLDPATSIGVYVTQIFPFAEWGAPQAVHAFEASVYGRLAQRWHRRQAWPGTDRCCLSRA
jgi:hypothetical protein